MKSESQIIVINAVDNDLVGLPSWEFIAEGLKEGWRVSILNPRVESATEPLLTCVTA